ncbi:MAG: hypothetical protein PHU33_17390, partial [Bacteroidales bacterium]|nr:hypothetical protein [Bacteroidales bacterium]
MGFWLWALALALAPPQWLLGLSGGFGVDLSPPRTPKPFAPRLSSLSPLPITIGALSLSLSPSLPLSLSPSL